MVGESGGQALMPLPAAVTQPAVLGGFCAEAEPATMPLRRTTNSTVTNAMDSGINLFLFTHETLSGATSSGLRHPCQETAPDEMVIEDLTPDEGAEFLAALHA